MRNDDGTTGGTLSDTDSMSTDRTAFSGPLVAGKEAYKKSARFNLPPYQAGASRQRGSSSLGSTEGDDDAYVEITLDIIDESVTVQSVKTAVAGGDTFEDPELAVLQRQTLEKKNTPSKFRQVSQELRRFASFSRPPSNRFYREKSAAHLAIKGLKFIAGRDGGGGGDSRWQQVENRFNELTAKHNSNGRLNFSFFSECIGMNKESKGFAKELFRAVAKRLNITGDTFNKAQLQEVWKELSNESFDSRLQIFFDMVDKDADGRITQEEVAEIITLSASANMLKNISDKAKEYAALIMEELDPVNAGYIMIKDLEMLLLQAPDQSVRISDNRIFSQLLSQQLNPTRESNSVYQWFERAKYFVTDHWKRVWVMILYIAIVSGLFAYKFAQYRNKAAFGVMGYCVCVAKGGAETLKFNMALVLLPVCRNTITWLRNKTKLGMAVPFDDNLNFHKVVAAGIAVGVGLHAVSHLTCDFPRIIHATPEQYEPMKKYFGEEQPDNYWWFIKGVEGITGILMVVLMGIAFTLAMPWFRLKVSKPVDRPMKPLEEPAKPLEEPAKPLEGPAKPVEQPPKPLEGPAKPVEQPPKPDKQPPKPDGRLTELFGRVTGFNAFWYTHHLFVVVYALLLIHGIQLYLTKKWYQKTTWMYLAVPVVIYGSERLVRALRSRIEPVRILKVAVYPAKVLVLHMSKPHGFKYKSGQYMFVNCSTVSPFEWHPFSITSSPGDDYLSVHIRDKGDWTNEIKFVFSKVCRDSSIGKSGLMRAEYNPGKEIPATTSFPKIRIDGPYGAPAQDYKNYDVVLLVGLGIGATPMVSIVKDIINNIKINERSDLEKGRGGSVNPSGFRTQKAYFYWSTREQGSFEWFKGMMDEVAEMDEGRVIEMHNYCTSVYEEGDARSALITMLQTIHHAKNGVDVVSGTRVKTHFGRPNWRQVYKNIALHHPHTRVGVFYCGLPGPGKEVENWALDFSHKTSTKFEFHKENF